LLEIVHGRLLPNLLIVAEIVATEATRAINATGLTLFFRGTGHR
jgi:hypothetical protein